jgi:hypothetical protein
LKLHANKGLIDSSPVGDEKNGGYFDPVFGFPHMLLKSTTSQCPVRG